MDSRCAPQGQPEQRGEGSSAHDRGEGERECGSSGRSAGRERLLDMASTDMASTKPADEAAGSNAAPREAHGPPMASTDMASTNSADDAAGSNAAPSEAHGPPIASTDMASTNSADDAPGSNAAPREAHGPPMASTDMASTNSADDSPGSNAAPREAHGPPATPLTFSNDAREQIRKAVAAAGDRELDASELDATEFDAFLEDLETCIGLFEVNRCHERAAVERRQLEEVAKRARQLREALSEVDWYFLARTDRFEALLRSRERWLNHLGALESAARNCQSRWMGALKGLRQRAELAVDLPIPPDTHAHTASAELILRISELYTRCTGRRPGVSTSADGPSGPFFHTRRPAGFQLGQCCSNI